MDNFKPVHESHFLCLCTHCAASGTVGFASPYTLHSFGLFHLPVSGLWRFKIQTSYHFISIFKIMYLKDKDYKKESINKINLSRLEKSNILSVLKWPNCIIIDFFLIVFVPFCRYIRSLCSYWLISLKYSLKQISLPFFLAVFFLFSQCGFCFWRLHGVD